MTVDSQMLFCKLLATHNYASDEGALSMKPARTRAESTLRTANDLHQELYDDNVGIAPGVRSEKGDSNIGTADEGP